jgi:hypothetical protein
MIRTKAGLLILLALTFALGTPVELSNGLVGATLTSDGLMVGLRGAKSTLAHNFTNDAWRLELSAYNSSNSTVEMGPAQCGATPAVLNASHISAAFRYTCEPTPVNETSGEFAGSKWIVDVVYSLPEGAGYVQKNLRLCRAATNNFATTADCAKNWKATVRTVEVWRGLALANGKSYTGRVALEPTKGDFHPSNSTNNKVTYPGYGIYAQYIAGFYRRSASSDGLFVTLSNPFGEYFDPANQALYNKQSEAAQEEDDAIDWDMHTGYACNANNAHKFKFLGGNHTVADCETECAKNPQCAMFELNVDPTAKSHWCALYNVTTEPHSNSKFTCVCRTKCPTSPGPSPHPGPGPAPAPRPGPSPPPANLPPQLWARFEPLFLQTEQHDTFFEPEPALLGLTTLQAYDADSDSQVNLGEMHAFTDAVRSTLLDTPKDRNRAPVRVQVGWDANDYQIDIGTEAGRTEYKRMLKRDGQVGITHAIFAPRNSLQSARANATDAWGWEEALLLSMGEQIRTGKWLPQKGGKLPDEVQEMVSYAASQNVSLLAYAYPVLPFVADGAEPRNGDGWLYDGQRGKNGVYKPDYNNKPNPKNPNCTEPHTAPYSACSGTRASLANVGWQNYLAQTLISFVTASGCGGFAWDYTGFKDWRQPTDYAEWRGWQRVTALLRVAHPHIVMDHRQQSHNWGAWSHAAGSYTEPIAGDENPESYGAAGVSGIPTLSTDAVLANNLRHVNYVYRAKQLLPNVRIPGFMSHQSDRHFDDGQDPGSLNYSAVHQRDFDYHGFAFGLLSSVGTAGLNNVVAMLPARDAAESSAFDQTPMGKWARSWLEWADAEYQCLHNTIPLVALDRGAAAGGGAPRIGYLDGTASMLHDDSRGFLFVFNPGPRAVCAELVVDEGMGISNASASKWFLAHEIYPREEDPATGLHTPVGLWPHGSSQQVCVAPQSAKALRLSRVDDLTDRKALPLPLMLNLSYVSASISTEPSGKHALATYRINVHGARGLTGEDCRPVALAAIENRSAERIRSVYVNGHIVTSKGADCDDINSWARNSGLGCAVTRFLFAGDDKLRKGSEATTVSPDQNQQLHGGWFNSTIAVSSSMLEQLASQQKQYPVQWDMGVDGDATWLGGRLMLFAYVTQPNSTKTKPRLWLDGQEQTMLAAYNSRGFLVEKCFLGYYFDASHLSAGTKEVSLLMPELNVNITNTTAPSELLGLYWHGLEEVRTSELVTPLAGGNISKCEATAAVSAAERPMPPKGAKNVLYLLVDDLRPELNFAYNQSVMRTPHVDAFAKTATVFSNAYCQIAVCSPSRMSFVSGRRPDTISIYNFVNHIRQATCPATQGASTWAAAPYKNVTLDKTQGAAGECCSLCTKDPACTAWTYYGVSVTDGDSFMRLGSDMLHSSLSAKGTDHCAMYTVVGARVEAPMGAVSGHSGTFIGLTAHPENYQRQGYLTMQTGKVWHTEEGDPFGRGMPPLQDEGRSWDAGCSMADVNAVAGMLPCDTMVKGTQGCPINATLEGEVLDGTGPLCDKVISDDAIVKLGIAAKTRKETGRPFFLAVGFRKPHMPWRFPAPYTKLYPPTSSIELAAHPTMDASVPPIAHHTPDLQFQNGGNPYIEMNKSFAQVSSRHSFAHAHVYALMHCCPVHTIIPLHHFR